MNKRTNGEIGPGTGREWTRKTKVDESGTLRQGKSDFCLAFGSESGYKSVTTIDIGPGERV